MILSTHAVLGGATALIFPNPFASFLAGMASHFISDAVPHWHYPLRSLEKHDDPMQNKLRFDREFIFDCFVLGAECSLGFAAVLFGAYHRDPAMLPAVFFGAAGGVLPDFFQLIFHLFPFSFFRKVQEFHKRIHSEFLLDDRIFLGLGSQILIIASTLALFFI